MLKSSILLLSHTLLQQLTFYRIWNNWFSRTVQLCLKLFALCLFTFDCCLVTTQALQLWLLQQMRHPAPQCPRIQALAALCVWCVQVVKKSCLKARPHSSVKAALSFSARHAAFAAAHPPSPCCCQAWKKPVITASCESREVVTYLKNIYKN